MHCKNIFGSSGSHVVNKATNYCGSSMSSASHCSPMGSGSNHFPNSATHSVNHMRSGWTIFSLTKWSKMVVFTLNSQWLSWWINWFGNILS